MKIYVSHKRNSDFQKDLYLPLEKSVMAEKYKFIFPHEGNRPFDSKDIILNNKVNMVIAEVSYPATGQGIELGWAYLRGIPIICIYRTGSNIAGSLKTITDKFIEYSDIHELLEKLSREIDG